MRKIYKIKNLDCAVCADKIEKDLKKIFKKVSLNFAVQKLYMETDQNLDEGQILDIVNKTVKSYEPQALVYDISQKRQNAKRSMLSLGLLIKLLGAVVLAVA